MAVAEVVDVLDELTSCFSYTMVIVTVRVLRERGDACIWGLVVGHRFHVQNRLLEGQTDLIIKVTLVWVVVVVKEGPVGMKTA